MGLRLFDPDNDEQDYEPPACAACGEQSLELVECEDGCCDVCWYCQQAGECACGRCEVCGSDEGCYCAYESEEEEGVCFECGNRECINGELCDLTEDGDMDVYYADYDDDDEDEWDD